MDKNTALKFYLEVCLYLFRVYCCFLLLRQSRDWGRGGKRPEPLGEGFLFTMILQQTLCQAACKVVHCITGLKESRFPALIQCEKTSTRCLTHIITT